MKRRSRLATIAPGSRPASQRIWKPVADAQHRSSDLGEAPDLGHYRREARNRAGSQIVPVGKPAGENHSREIFEVRVAVPDELGLDAEHIEGVNDIVFAIRAGNTTTATVIRQPRR